ncbi:MAG: SDR family oxidoreductase [Dehalococcoidia bacterium]|jgi:multifunctional beta-oxidation protein|nr:SDR family oxidoreductase [Dehalococcoidia bacterium]
MSGVLEDKVAIVTGAGRGIGRAIAEELAANGAKVVVNDAGVSLSGEAEPDNPVDGVVAGIRASGGEAVSIAESVVTFDGGGRIVQAALDSFGRLDIVVTAAGILRDRMIYNMTEEEWDDVYSVHLKGTFNVVRHAAPLFRAQRGGRVITLTSESGLVGFSGQANYGAAKSGIAGFTKVVAKDLGKYGVTANSIAPRAETRMVESIPENTRARLAGQGLMPTGGEASWEPDDVAPFAAFLASDYSAPVNGQVFLVYGGNVIHMTPPRREKTIFNSTPLATWEPEQLDAQVKPDLLALPAVARSSPATQPASKRLDGKVAIVTGAGRGIGRGIAKAMAAQGASVVVADVGAALDGAGEDSTPAAQVVEEISELGGKAVASYHSVATMEGGGNIVKKAMEEFGRLDIVVTAAGILRDRMLFNMTEQEWDDVLAVHLKGTFSVIQPASKIFREQGSGRIVTFSSVSGLYGYGGQSNYGAAKDAIAGFTRVVAKDLAPSGVTANVISPGAHTRMTDSVPDSTRAMRKGEFLSPPEGVLSDDPEQVAPMIAWLASDQASDVTGRIFHCVGNRVSLMNSPGHGRSIHKDGRWRVEELAAIFQETIGLDLVNPAPPQD